MLLSYDSMDFFKFGNKDSNNSIVFTITYILFLSSKYNKN